MTRDSAWFGIQEIIWALICLNGYFDMNAMQREKPYSSII